MSIEAFFLSPIDPSHPSASSPTGVTEATAQPLAGTASAARNAAVDQDVQALETAVISSRVEPLRALIARGVSVTTPDEEGYLPLSFAVVHNRPEVIGLLLAHGADPLKVDGGGLCPLELAEALDHDVAIGLLLAHLGVALRPAEPLAA